MVLNQRNWEFRHDGPMFVNARWQLLTIKLVEALPREIRFESVVPIRRYSWQNRAAGITARIVTDGACPPVVVPRNPNRQMVSG